ncbi:MAG: hypothetical protein DRJ66_03995 [Thermoprotei archaeon]|nr:MAG: hypothetical protein DRJ66_03995 [Thermoprotei archaeon]
MLCIGESKNMIEIGSLFIQIDKLLDIIKLLFMCLWTIPIYRVYRLLKSLGDQEESPQSIKLSEARVAVAIPARNVKHYIRKVILSLLKQRKLPDLIILIDDSSTDGTLDEVQSLIHEREATLKRIIEQKKYYGIEYELYMRHKLIRMIVLRLKSHSGKSRALNVALNVICNENIDYLLVLDADTILEPDYIEKLTYVMELDPQIGVISGLVRLWLLDSNPIRRAFAKAFRELNSLIYSLTIRKLESAYGTMPNVNGCCALYRMEALKRIGGFPEDSLAEDAVITWELALRGYKASFLPDAIAYTVDSGSVWQLFKRMVRMVRGGYQGFIIRLRKLARKRLWQLITSIIYNYFGGLAFVVNLVDLPISIYLLKHGLGGWGLLEYLAYITHLSPLSLVFTFFSAHPLMLCLLSYLTGLSGLVISGICLLVYYRKKPYLTSALKNAIKYAPLGVLLVWLQSIACMIALPLAVYDILTGGNKCRW